MDQNITADQVATTYSCEASNADETADKLEVTTKRDATAPEISLVVGPADGGSYYFGFVPASPTCEASDASSGLDDVCSVTGYATTVSTHTVTASAIDVTGNINSDSATYEVLAWTLKDFYQPIDLNGIWNVIKGDLHCQKQCRSF